MLARYWWSHNKSDRGIHWKSWAKLGMVKSKGGLEFRDLESFNRALDPGSLVAQFFKKTYFK